MDFQNFNHLKKKQGGTLWIFKIWIIWKKAREDLTNFQNLNHFGKKKGGTCVNVLFDNVKNSFLRGSLCNSFSRWFYISLFGQKGLIMAPVSPEILIVTNLVYRLSMIVAVVLNGKLNDTNWCGISFQTLARHFSTDNCTTGLASQGYPKFFHYHWVCLSRIPQVSSEMI